MIISRYLDIIQDILNEIAAIVNIFFNSFFPSSPSAVSIISQFFLQMIRSRSVYQKNKDNKYERFSIFNVSCAKKGGGGSFGSSDPPPSFLCRISSSDACVPLALNHFFHRFDRCAVNIVQEILECRNRLAAV